MIPLDEYNTLYDLLHKLDEQAILEECHNADKNEKNWSGYPELLTHLKTLEPKPSQMVITVRYIEKDDWYDVTGYENNEYFAIEFTPWCEWLGMKFTTKNCDISLARIAAECLNEMTWMGWEEEGIQEVKEGLIEQVDELQQMTEEELKEHLIEWKPEDQN